ncbi:HIPL1 protein-like [Iris pallida]|uniref:HIPL1 protein-like n=1 Tax=Iris pallida TaxID=29817 RepID=A0AAX6DP65_IRIPA|nr:HIPL1 protein-like [Iris pallida]KAJ6823765.1 HIPL1 protein-like [Iris pallida]
MLSPSILFFFFLILPYSFGLQLCTDSRAPITLKTPLKFCSYSGSSCCNATDDSAIQKQFESMDISDTSCASLVQSILCVKCSPFAADLFDFEPKVRTVPILCNSSALASSVQSKKDTTGDYCTQVWNTCKDATIWNSPFAPSLQGSDGLPDSSSSKITSFWQSETDFCEAFGGPLGDDSPCFNGSSALFNSTANSPTPNGLCLEKIGNGSYLNMAAHPDGSNRVFFADQPGKIWLAIVPGKGSGGTLSFDESSPFLDITDEVVYESAFGVMGLAFHPNFATNGRFFVSYNCDKVQSASCSGRCSCNSDVDCDPSKLGPDDGTQPCQIHTVVAEYTANSSSSMPSKATYASPSEVRRIFTMGLPFTSHHGGQILFGPQDGYLYFMMGDGGGKGGDPYNFSQNKKSLLGKIMRLNIDNIPSESEIDDLGLWGNYSIPKDNPSADDKELQPEIWATGLRNPWRCSFDSERPSYFICADVGQDTYEEVDLISKGGNYGWRVYEGPLVYNSSSFPGRNTSAASINAIFPVMGYTHSVLNNSVGSASITGGYVYRSTTDPCMFGRYLYADLYAGAMWAGTENPENSGNYSSTMIPFGCSKESPIPCDTVAGTSVLSLGYIYSFGEDNSRDVFLLTSKGVYRVVPPSRCGYTCPLEKTSDGGNPAPSPSSSASQLESRHKSILRIAAAFLVIIYGCL